MSPSGAGSYTIQGGSAVVSPTVSSTYTVMGTSSEGCLSQAFATSSITVYSNPTISVNSGSICVGQSFTMSPSGASSYTFQGGSVVVSPTVSSTYTVVGTSSEGCFGIATVSLVVSPSINVTLIASHTAVCYGSGVTLTAVGATSYTWLPYASLDSQNGNQVTASPTVSTTFTVIGDQNGCSKTVTITVTVHPKLDALAGKDTMVYIGYAPMECIKLQGSASGGSMPFVYTWSNGSATATTNVCPKTTTTYTLLVTDANGCTDMDEIVVKYSKVKCWEDKVYVCHERQTICVDIDEVSSYLIQGARPGKCNETDPDYDGSDNLFIIYPNPNTGLFTIKVRKADLSADVKIEISDPMGRKIYSMEPKVNNGSIDETIAISGELEAGVYSVQLKYNKKMHCRKMVLLK
jgi:hypothetical protein